MSSTHKTFQTGEILSADDVNNALNPDTADHIARAITAGVTTIRTNSSPGTAQAVTVPLPSGRFSKPPIVVTSVATAAGGTGKIISRGYDTTPTTMKICLFMGDGQNLPSSQSVPVSWIAIQMDA
ncbi:hypothetical protein JMX17_06690 [Cutibacterium avidum]|uniref:hypothetical protein n=1 Tax=Cutibacterium avidum TaxID=33010 RepID=UPI00192B8DB8|nr:hypothetical protein [Cutibacterium avidum]MDU5380545.1 hypothetical protein [Actinomyces sp.]MDU5416722.1 hypothetical protein [Cutibacterium avidum]MDU5420278.1 hypothetical protein [Cutibacterium avidum]QQY11866.1 hypothetical protein JMX17_06690 [Cutibacterium avidum]